MIDSDNITKRLAGEMPRLRSDFGVAELYIFGSAARDDSNPSSDVDVLVRFVDPKSVTLYTLSDLLVALEQVLGRRVDLVEDHPRLNPRFRARIQRDLKRVA